MPSAVGKASYPRGALPPLVFLTIKYAENVGLAFQIIDDILDYRDGKIELNSFLTHFDVDDAASKAKELTQKGIDAIKPFYDGTLSSLANYLITRNY